VRRSVARSRTVLSGAADSVAVAGGRVYVIDYIEGVYSVPASCGPADQDESTVFHMDEVSLGPPRPASADGL
jgi:hypothetical protein